MEIVYHEKQLESSYLKIKIPDKSLDSYHGNWHLYFVHRDYSSDILGLADIGTGKAEYDEGSVYELSDEKFIFNLMNFERDLPK